MNCPIGPEVEMVRWLSLMCRPSRVALLGLTGLLCPLAAVAQSADTIVQSLRPKPLTRSLVPHPSVSPEDREFLQALPSRSIRIDRSKLSDIVKKDELPKIDLTINFDYDSDAIAPTSIPTVVELGKALTNPSLASARILLNGHTDAAGNDRYNLALSERRAQSVKSYLVSHFGINDDRLFAVGFGREQLKNKAEPLAAENRRVEIVNMSAN